MRPASNSLNGQLLLIRPEAGKSLVLRRSNTDDGGNLDIPNNITISSSEFTILQYNANAFVHDGNGNMIKGAYIILAGSGGGSVSSGGLEF